MTSIFVHFEMEVPAIIMMKKASKQSLEIFTWCEIKSRGVINMQKKKQKTKQNLTKPNKTN